MKKGKILFIMLVVIVFAGGMLLYIQKHGTLRTSGQADKVSQDISAGQAVLIDGDTGKVLYEKAADEKAYPASTTKIMTALVTLETLKKYDSPIDQLIEVPRCAEGVEGSSLYLKAGERISIEDLLYGLMLVSGNDAAVALAEVIGGSQEEFVEMMNIRAAELGCTGTNFVNPNGLFDDNHYTTARDMALIACEAMKNETFRKIVGSQQWNAASRESTYVTFRNKNKQR